MLDSEKNRPGHTLPSDTSAALKLWIVLSRAQAAVAEHSRAHVAASGLSPMEFAALEALFSKGPLLVGELQEKVLISSGGMTYVVDQLVKKGLAERRPCPRDRRARYAALTDEGRALMERIFPDHARCIARAVGGLDEEETEVAIRLLKKLGRSAAELPAPCREGGMAPGG